MGFLFFASIVTISLSCNALIKSTLVRSEQEPELITRESVVRQKLERSKEEQERARQAQEKMKEADQRIREYKTEASNELLKNNMTAYKNAVHQQQVWETTKKENEKIIFDAQERANKLEKNAQEIRTEQEKLTKDMEKPEFDPAEEQFMRCIKTNVIGSLQEPFRKNLSSSLTLLNQLTLELKRLKNYERITFVNTQKFSLADWQKIYTTLRSPKSSAPYDPTYREILTRIDKLQGQLEKQLGTKLRVSPTDQAFACRSALFVKQKALDKLDEVTNWDI